MVDVVEEGGLKREDVVPLDAWPKENPVVAPKVKH